MASKPASDIGDFAKSERPLGDKVRALRTRRGWTLAELAARANLAASTLSRLENNQLSLTYHKLLQLCRGLGVELSELLSNDGPAAAQGGLGRMAVTQEGEGRGMQAGDYYYRYLCNELRHKKMTPIFGIVTARSLDEAGELSRHEGEEFVYVLKGTLEFHSELYEPRRIEAGGSFYFDSRMGHAFVSAGAEPVEMLSVCLAPEAALTDAAVRQRAPKPAVPAG